MEKVYFIQTNLKLIENGLSSCFRGVFTHTGVEYFLRFIHFLTAFKMSVWRTHVSAGPVFTIDFALLCQMPRMRTLLFTRFTGGVLNVLNYVHTYSGLSKRKLETFARVGVQVGNCSAVHVFLKLENCASYFWGEDSPVHSTVRRRMCPGSVVLCVLPASEERFSL